MSEKLHISSGSEESEKAANNDVRYPTEAELREFERVRNVTVGGLYSIADFARDPEHPTEEEVKMMNDFNGALPKAFDDLSFEDYFGYPDPRKSKHEGQGDQHDSDNRPEV